MRLSALISVKKLVTVSATVILAFVLFLYTTLRLTAQGTPVCYSGFHFSPELLIGCVADAGFVRATDVGWQKISLPFEGWGPIAVAPDQTFYLLNLDNSKIYRSADEGETWMFTGTAPLTPTTDQYGTLYPSPITDMIFPGVLDAPFIPDVRGIYKSTDRGATWKRVFKDGQGADVAFSPNFAHDGIAFVALIEYHTSLGIWKTEDWGETWFPVNNGLKVGTTLGAHQWVAISPQFSKDQTAFTSDAYGLYKTANGGESWVRVSQSPVTEVIFSPDYINDQIILLRRSPMGLYLSEDGGQTVQIIYNNGVEFLNAGLSYATPFEWMSSSFLAQSEYLPSSHTPDTATLPLEFWIVSQEEYFGDAYLYRSRDYGISWEPISIYPQLAVTQHSEPRFIQSGGSLTYTLRLTNTGTLILHTTLTDTLPAHIVSGVIGSGSTMLPGGMLTWQPTLTAPFGVWSATVGVMVEDEYTGPITNVVTISSIEGVTGVYTYTVTVYKSRMYLPLIYR